MFEVVAEVIRQTSLVALQFSRRSLGLGNCTAILSAEGKARYR
jgi:hypothetical protein